MDIYNSDYTQAEGPKRGELEEFLRKDREVAAIQRENFRRAHAAGAKMVFGTDAGIYPHGHNAKQFAVMVRYGMTPLQAIQSATVNAAAHLQISDVAGSLTPGHSADVIAVSGDPLQDANITSFRAIQSVDKALVAPVAKSYQDIVPEPVRDGLGNALRNLTEPVNFLNFLLQFKIGKAAETLGRFAVNTTFGVGGLVDVAKTKPFNLPYRRNGFANTLGFYGVEPGAYFYLPLVGPTTLRDLAGNSIDLLVVPTAVGAPFDRTAYAVPTTVIKQLNDRIENAAEIERLQEESADPYVETRTLYLE